MLGVKVYITDGKELILEPSLKWAGNPNLTVSIKAFGLRATVQVVDLQVFAKPRITLKPLVPHFPCFAKILVSLMEKPHVDFGLELLGADVMAIPGLYRFVQELIKDQIANMYLWPKTWVGKHDKMGMNVICLKDLLPNQLNVITLDLLKSMTTNDVGKSCGLLVVEVNYKPFKEEEEDIPNEEEEEEEEEVPNDDFDEDSNKVDQEAPKSTLSGRGSLVVVIHEAEDVEGKYHTNPHVKIMFRGEKRKTKRIKKNRHPRWDEDFTFMLEEPPKNDRIHVEVVSTSLRIGLLHPKEILGYVDINLENVVSNKRINEKYHLIDSKNGKIRIELQWRTSS
ncbi:C2 calcium-dependent membrane targeting [Macleaya cordata]|uniref:C2 calcium-dependent membrane targeting n=1 Tax=Macleaya cordata TaxID=56857 RepID=A0A200R0K0_MACCD|nr:C2 calcium-dependent membrane targeting [Macleaya cordata]